MLYVAQQKVSSSVAYKGNCVRNATICCLQRLIGARILQNVHHFSKKRLLSGEILQKVHQFDRISEIIAQKRL